MKRHASAGSGRIDKSRYVSPEFLRLELDKVFPRAWLLAGPVSDLDSDGSYFTFDVADETLLVVRDGDEVRAFHNVCAHRGRRLCEPGLGHASVIRCPYHHWAYGLDGRLCGLPEAEHFPSWTQEDRPRLRGVSAKVWGGFVWVCMGSDPEPFEEFIAPISDRLSAYSLHEFALVEDQTVDLPCNWKVGVDAFNEAYHLRAVHPQLLEMLDERNVELELFGRHSCIRVPFGLCSPNLGDRTTLNAHLKSMLEEAGVDPARFDRPTSEVRGAIQQALRARADVDVAALTDDQLVDNHQYYVFPNLTLNLYALKHMLIRHRPHPTDPNRMLLDQQQYVRLRKNQARPARPKHERFRYGAGSLGFVTDQDTFNLVRVQRGMNSSGFDGLLLGDNERRIRHMHESIDGYLHDED